MYVLTGFDVELI